MGAIESTIRWENVDDSLPDLDKEVLVVTSYGIVGYGQRSERAVLDINEQGIYRPTNKKAIQWGVSENDGEYWYELHNVALWAYFPDSPIGVTK